MLRTLRTRWNKGNDWFLHKLLELGQQKPSALKLLVTSRQSPHIEKAFKEPLILSINLDRRLIAQDIASYIHHWLSDRPANDISKDQRELIQTTVRSKANEFSIYARLMMDEIPASVSSTNIEALLGSLPIGMDDMYTTVLSEHSRRSGVTHELQASILQWITHATRPLCLLEVAVLMRSVSRAHDSLQ